MANHSQQLKEGLHPVPVIADVVQVALGNAASLQQLVALQVLLLCNPENSTHSNLPLVKVLGQFLLAVTRACIAYASNHMQYESQHRLVYRQLCKRQQSMSKLRHHRNVLLPGSACLATLWVTVLDSACQVCRCALQWFVGCRCTQQYKYT